LAASNSPSPIALAILEAVSLDSIVPAWNLPASFISVIPASAPFPISKEPLSLIINPSSKFFLASFHVSLCY
jgi:hypothetical protein